MKDKIFLISSHQKDEINEYCLNRCKKCQFASVTLDLGEIELNCLPCKEENCPYQEAILEIGEVKYTDWGTKRTFLRKLRKLKRDTDESDM